jgi:hypothetical protein
MKEQADSRPRMANGTRNGTSADFWHRQAAIHGGNRTQFLCMATLFAVGAGDGNRTRTVSLGRVLILPCFRVQQRYWRPQLASGDPYRPGLVARAWPGSLASRAENRALAEVAWPRIAAT